MVSLFNPLSGSSGGLSVPTFNMSVLSLYYTSGVALGQSLHAEVLKGGILGELLKRSDKVDTIPPWIKENPAAEDLTNHQKVFSGEKLIDLTHPTVDRPGVDDTTRNLFALYRAIDRMEALTAYAQTNQGQTQTILLERRFQQWAGEIRDFINDRNNEFADITLLAGLNNSTLTSSLKRDAIDPVDLALGLPIDDVFVGAKVTDTRFAAIPTITGTETFTMSVTENSVTTNLAVDLSAAASTQIDDIAAYLSGLLSGAGFATAVQVERNHETSYSLEIVGSSGETLSFSAPSDDEAAVYVAGRTGGGEFSNGFVTKLDGLGTADPTQVLYNNIFTQQADSADAIAVDSDGYVWVVGTTKGAMDDQVATAATDVFLTKYDHSGREVFTRMLGAASDASAYSIAIDASDNVFIAGQTFAPLTDMAPTYNTGISDSYVTKFDSSGQELWTRQTAPYSPDGAASVTVDTTGNVYVAGFVNGQLAGSETYNGGKDAYVTKLDSDGALVYNQQFGTAGDENATAIAVDSAGNIFVGGKLGANGFVRTYDDSGGTPVLDWETDLGDLGTGGTVAQIVLQSGGNPVIVGSSTNAALDNVVREAHSGGLDGYALEFNSNNGNINWATYTGTASDDYVYGVTIDPGSNDLYLSGATEGVLAGESDQPATTDAFVTKFDQNGNLDWTHQFGGSPNHKALAIAFDADGSNILSRLGLPSGTLFPTEARTITSQTTVRPGQYFYTEVDGGARTRITIDEDDTFSFLAFRINAALGTSGKAEMVQTGSTESLLITAQNGASIRILAGDSGFDALAGLGLKEARILGAPTPSADEEEQTLLKASRFFLGFTGKMNVTSKKDAEEAQILMDNALRELRDAYRYTVVGYEEPKETVGPAPPALAAKIAAYEDALRRISAIAGSGGSSGGLFGL